MIEVKGFDDAVQMMKKLDQTVSRKELIRLVRPATRVFTRAIKRRTPIASKHVREFWGKRMNVQPGSLKKSVRAIFAKESIPDQLRILIGPTALSSKSRSKAYQSKNSVDNDGWFRHFVIRGTAGFTMKSGKNKGKYIPGQPANPFVDKAISSVGARGFAKFEKDFVTTVNKIANQ